jgi:uncharacterized membrane protein YdbT with pleckstrin-like domain
MAPMAVGDKEGWRRELTGYQREDLLPAESLILKHHPHWIVVVKYLPAQIALVVVVLIADFTFLMDVRRLKALHPENYQALPEHFRTWLAFGAIAIAGLWLIVVLIRRESTSYTLTDQRIKIDTGVFGRQTKTIPIDRVMDCSTKQSLFGRMLGYGRVEVDAAGAEGAEVLEHLPNPGIFRDHVFVLSEKRREGTPAVPANAGGI